MARVIYRSGMETVTEAARTRGASALTSLQQVDSLINVTEIRFNEILYSFFYGFNLIPVTIRYSLFIKVDNKLSRPRSRSTDK